MSLGSKPNPVSSIGAVHAVPEKLGALYVSISSYAGPEPTSGPGQRPSGLSALDSPRVGFAKGVF